MVLRPKIDVPQWRPSVIAVIVVFGVCVQAACGQGQRLDLQKDVGIDQRLNAPLPLHLTFRDSTGQEVQLGDYFGSKPVILILVYYKCPMLCNLELKGLVRSLRPLEFSAGEEFTVVTVSFNPREGPQLAAKKKETYLQRYDRPKAAEGWHFLTGEKGAIEQLTEAVGFRYKPIPQKKQFAHAAGLMIATPEGKLSRYFYGVDHPPRDLRLGLVEASQNKIGSATDQVLLLCYQYDPTTGRYGLAIMNALRVGGVLTVLGLGTAIWVMLRRERTQQDAREPQPES